jgi:hypothetical protein
MKSRDANRGIGFIDRTVRLDAGGVLGHPSAIPQRRVAAVSSARVYLIQNNH